MFFYFSFLSGRCLFFWFYKFCAAILNYNCPFAVLYHCISFHSAIKYLYLYCIYVLLGHCCFKWLPCAVCNSQAWWDKGCQTTCAIHCDRSDRNSLWTTICSSATCDGTFRRVRSYSGLQPDEGLTAQNSGFHPCKICSAISVSS